MILINGEYKNDIDIRDRGFQYGDGLFETLLVTNGQPVFWDDHWQRLEAGCQRLNIPVPNTEQVLLESKRLCSQASSNAVLKIIITRGIGGRGYRQPDSINPTRILSLHGYPDYPDNYKDKGITARFCNTRLGLNSLLAGIKHLNRLEQVLARAEWTDTLIQEGIMLDINDHVIEGTMSNLFYVKNGKLFTSSIINVGIAGIIRKIIISLSGRYGLQTQKHAFDKSELLSADEIFVCNSIIGIWPITQIDDKKFQLGSITKQIQQWLERYTCEAVNQ